MSEESFQFIQEQCIAEGTEYDRTAEPVAQQEVIPREHQFTPGSDGEDGHGAITRDGGHFAVRIETGGSFQDRVANDERRGDVPDPGRRLLRRRKGHHTSASCLQRGIKQGTESRVLGDGQAQAPRQSARARLPLVHDRYGPPGVWISTFEAKTGATPNP